MLPRPTIEDVIAHGRTLGLALSQAEARSMQSRMLEHIDSFERFHELRIEEEHLPLDVTDRDPGYRPTEDEDPLNVFIRKCWVAGADEGPLTRQDHRPQGPHQRGRGAAHPGLAFHGRLYPRL